jgi:hypothetical protein
MPTGEETFKAIKVILNEADKTGYFKEVFQPRFCGS